MPLAPRLNTRSYTTVGEGIAVKAYPRTCAECGADFKAFVRSADFCTKKCRRDFNNRRQQRGAELYDLIMAHRFERAEATRLGVWTKLSQLASKFKAEDVARRAGRKSWRSITTVLARHSYLNAVVLVRGRK